MWRRIEIRNYRSIEHVSVDLAPFTVVVGPNGSGKSNFVDALVFARDIARDASVAVQSRGGIASIRRWTKSKPAQVSIDVRVASTKAALDTDFIHHGFVLASENEGGWSFQKEFIEARKKGAPVLLMNRIHTQAVLKFKEGRGTIGRRFKVNETTSAMVETRQLAPFDLMPALRSVRRYRLNPEAMRQPQLTTERSRLDESGSNIAEAIKSLRKKPQWKTVLLAMGKLVPGLKDIYDGSLGRYMGVQFTQSQRSGGEATFTSTEMSEGAIRALGILVAAQQMSRDELLVLEEPEISIHSGAAIMLFNSLKRASTRGAVLLTTHSAELLDAAKDEEILVCDYRHGITRLGPMETEQRNLVKGGLLSTAELMYSEPLRIEGEPPDVISYGEVR